MTAVTAIGIWVSFGILTNPLYTVTEKISIAVVIPLLIGGVAHAFGAFSPDSMIPKLVAEQDVRTGMYLSLALRNQLGLVNTDNSLLHFSSKDEFSYTRKLTDPSSNKYYANETVLKMESIIRQANTDLLDLVWQAKQWMKANSQKTLSLPTCHFRAFTGHEVARQLEEILEEKDFKQTLDIPSSKSKAIVLVKDPFDIHAVARRLIIKLRLLDRKIEVLKEIDMRARELSFESSTLSTILKMLVGIQDELRIRFSFNYMIKEKSYRKQFESDYQRNSYKIGDGKSLTEQDLYGQVNLEALPIQGSAPRTDSIYDTFKYQIQVAKGQLNSGVIKKPYEIVGLSANFSRKEYGQMHNKYVLDLHPDKVSKDKKTEATELFKVFQSINKILLQDLEERGLSI